MKQMTNAQRSAQTIAVITSNDENNGCKTHFFIIL